MQYPLYTKLILANMAYLACYLITLWESQTVGKLLFSLLFCNTVMLSSPANTNHNAKYNRTIRLMMSISFSFYWLILLEFTVIPTIIVFLMFAGKAASFERVYIVVQMDYIPGIEVLHMFF